MPAIAPSSRGLPRFAGTTDDVEEHLLQIAAAIAGDQARRRIVILDAAGLEHDDAVAQSLDLGEFLDRETGKLSSGQRTRVALAKALLNAPEVLLLDEPTASLDPDTADWVRGWLERYRQTRGATILLASHNMLEVERLCERVIIMRRGAIVDDDAPAALLARYGRDSLEQVFLDVARGQGTADA